MSPSRLTRTLTSAVAAAAVTLTPLTVSSTAEAAPAAEGTRSLATVLAPQTKTFDSRWDDSNVLAHQVNRVLAARPNSKVKVLADGRVRLTAFLPTDRAFRRLVADVTGKRLPTERRVNRWIRDHLSVGMVEAVLLYHVVPGRTITYQQAGQANGASLSTALRGTPIRVRVTGGQVQLVDRNPDNRNATVVKAESDINKGNRQIAHGITEVLLPNRM
jgi:uncharacterized surface protein with fasciclin (FAS1) repeats